MEVSHSQRFFFIYYYLLTGIMYYDIIVLTNEVNINQQEDKTMDRERRYLLKQEAEVYEKLERFLLSMEGTDVSKQELTDLWIEAGSGKSAN